MSVEILLTDDHRLLREGLRSLLENQGFRVTGEAAEGRTAVKLAKKLKPDALIIDINMPGLNGIEATKQILQDCSGVKVIILSMRSDSCAILEAFAAGASAYLLKEAVFEEVVVAVKVVVQGKTYVSPAIADLVVRKSVEHWSASPGQTPRGISARERQILQLIAEGRSSKEMAGSLYVSVKTIETHRKQIMDKLDLHSIAELTKYAIREGITSF
ncbi:MAG TPA: response regulator transcription factor [Candidatus Binatia bacterium]|nr:response regulator transcription factor [Candidatus Binatia bacterium]